MPQLAIIAVFFNIVRKGGRGGVQLMFKNCRMGNLGHPYQYHSSIVRVSRKMFVNQTSLYRLRPELSLCFQWQIEMQTCRPACRTRTSGPEPRFWVTLILSWRKPFKIVILPHQYFSSWASLFLLSICNTWCHRSSLHHIPSLHTKNTQNEVSYMQTIKWVKRRWVRW